MTTQITYTGFKVTPCCGSEVFTSPTRISNPFNLSPQQSPLFVITMLPMEYLAFKSTIHHAGLLLDVSVHELPLQAGLELPSTALLD